MLLQRLARALVPAIVLVALAASYASCSSSADSGSSDAGDDHAAIDLDSTLPPSEASTCDPCQQRCPCHSGDYFYNPAQCGNEYCTNGVWGGVSCTVGPGCPSCDPCKQMCSCTPYDFVFNDAACIIEVCPQNGMWGDWDCTGSGCPPEGGVDGGDASLDGGSDVATNEAGADVIAEGGAD